MVLMGLLCICLSLPPGMLLGFFLALSDVCLFVWSYSGLFVLFFISFYCCYLDCWFTTDRKDVDLDGRESGEDPEKVGGRETIIRIC